MELGKDQVKRCVIITGMSGGGKSTALKVFEDQGMYSIDNLPPPLLPQLMEVLARHRAAQMNGVAAVVDVRGGELLQELSTVLSKLEGNLETVFVIFLDASDETLVRRFETTRRRHPLGADMSILEGITRERALLRGIRERAEIVLDTTNLSLNELRDKLLMETGISSGPLTILVSSFGFKHGLPQDADYLFDVRFLPNPNYIDVLHNLSGLDAAVQDYLDDIPQMGEFLKRVEYLFDLIIPEYSLTGRKQIHIAIGCTGGRHRSVAIAERLGRALQTSGRRVVVNHRDIHKEYPVT